MHNLTFFILMDNSQAATGSGKTLAFIWPMVVHINDQPHIVPGVDGPIGVVLTPTRELAKQVYKYAKTFIECIGGKAIEVAGGNKGTWELTKELKKGCEIVVSSPGRLIDMVKKKGTNLKRVTFLVLDEADRMESPRLYCFILCYHVINMKTR